MQHVLEEYAEGQSGDTEKELLLLTLTIINRFLHEYPDLEDNWSNYRSAVHGYQLHEILLKLSSPANGTGSPSLARLVHEVLSENVTILGECNYSLEKVEDILSGFRDCLDIDVGLADSPILRDVTSGYQLVGLHFQV